MTIVQLTNQASIYITAVVLKKLCKLLPSSWRALLPDIPRTPHFWK